MIISKLAFITNFLRGDYMLRLLKSLFLVAVFAFSLVLAPVQNAKADIYGYDLTLNQMVLTVKENGQLIAQLPFEEENPNIALLANGQKSFMALYANSALETQDYQQIYFLSLPGNNHTVVINLIGDYASLFVSSSYDTPTHLLLDGTTFIDTATLLNSNSDLQGNGQVNTLLATQRHLPYQNTSYFTTIPDHQLSDFNKAFFTTFPLNAYYQWTNEN